MATNEFTSEENTNINTNTICPRPVGLGAPLSVGLFGIPPQNQVTPANTASGFAFGFAPTQQTKPSGFGCGLPNPPTNNRCFPTLVPNQQNSIQHDEKKKQLVESLYSELTVMRAQIDKLNKSIDSIYEVLRYI
jgi:hypothetical protein